MPGRLPPSAIWRERCAKVWERDGRKCVRCGTAQTLKESHIDHIVPPGRGGTHAQENLQCLCRRCYVLRLGPNGMMHEGMIAKAVADGVVPSDWRPLAWEDGDLGGEAKAG